MIFDKTNLFTFWNLGQIRHSSFRWQECDTEKFNECTAPGRRLLTDNFMEEFQQPIQKNEFQCQEEF